MEEINAWEEYEAGTTQNARSLGTRKRSAARQRRASVAVDAASSSNRPLPFGTDDDGTAPTTLKKTEDDPEKERDECPDEWKDLARDAFRAYFNSDDSNKGHNAKVKLGSKVPLSAQVNGTMPYLTSYLAKLQPAPYAAVVRFAEASFRGMAQVYFQNSPLSGIFILAGLFVQSTRVAVHGIIAILAGNLAGVWMGFDQSLLYAGLFGYNSFLVGLALATFYSPEKHEDYYWPVAVGAVVFAYLSSVLFVMLGKILSPYKTPPFTLPFNISTIFFLLALGGMNNVEMASVRPPALPTYDSGPVSLLTAKAFFAGSIRGVGQVYLADDLVAGLLILVGIMLCSRISALAAFLGSAVGAAVAALVGCNRDAIESGMYGFNPSLTLTAMLMFYVPSVGSFSIGIIASIITVFIQLALATSLEPCGLPFMTLPFCISALAFVVIQGTTSNVISVPLASMTTPEDHLERVRRLSKGFELLHGAIKSADYKGMRNWRKSILPSFDSNSKRMASALDNYNEAIYGDMQEKNSMFFNWCCTNKEYRVERRGSFTMSAAVRKSTFDDEEQDSYTRMFNHIVVGDEFAITRAQFKQFLQSTGLADEVGLDFACDAFQLIDLDGSGDIDCDEFFAFVQISKSMPGMRQKIVNFFDFVSGDGDGAVTISEIDSARSYLGLSPLSEKDHESLVAFCDENKELEFEVIVNFVTIFKLKSIIKEYKSKRQHGHTLDESIHSSLKF